MHDYAGNMPANAGNMPALPRIVTRALQIIWISPGPN